MTDSRPVVAPAAWPAGTVPAILATLGSLAMGVGFLVYLADRARGPIAWVPALAGLADVPLFGAVGDWLPSFVHPFAFALFTAAASARGPRPAYGACGAWWAVNVAFEAGQHAALRVPLAEFLQGLPGDSVAARGLSTYFLNGTFDVGDLVATTLGALAAACVLRQLHGVEARHAK